MRDLLKSDGQGESRNVNDDGSQNDNGSVDTCAESRKHHGKNSSSEG